MEIYNKSGVYIIINPFGLVYIGQTQHLKDRLNSHRHSEKIIKNRTDIAISIGFYGFEKHTFKIIEYCNKEDLFIKEQYWQEYYDSCDNGLNSMKSTGLTSAGTHSDATKLRITKSKTGVESKKKGIPSGVPFHGKLYYDNIVFDNLTGVYYRSIREAAKFNNINRITLQSYLSGYRKNKKNNLTVV